MAEDPNAGSITHGPAQLGDRSVKEGGGGMLKGLQSIFATGASYGVQQVLGTNKTSGEINNFDLPLLSDKDNDN